MNDPVLGVVTNKPIDYLIPIDVPADVSVSFRSSELIAVCPVTGQPDHYEVAIYLSGGGRSIESKSLKLYLQHFRDVGIFAESLCQKILYDVLRDINPTWLSVQVIQGIRGGIRIEASSVYAADGAPHDGGAG